MFMFVAGFISFMVRPLFIEWQRFASSSLGLLMLKYLDENEHRWQSIADREKCDEEQASECCAARNVTCASIEVTEVCSLMEAPLPVVPPSEPDDMEEAGADSSAAQGAECGADCDECSQNCCNDVPHPQAESRRGSLPTCDTVPLVSAAVRRRNSAPVIGHSAALAVKKHLLATLAEHMSSFCTPDSSTVSEHFSPTASYVQYHDAVGSRRSGWTAVAPWSSGSGCVGVEGRPRDRRSNSHAVVFRQCLLASRLTSRRFSSPALGNDHWMSRDSESVPLLNPVIPSNTVCSQSALVNWFVLLLLRSCICCEDDDRNHFIITMSIAKIPQLIITKICFR